MPAPRPGRAARRPTGPCGGRRRVLGDERQPEEDEHLAGAVVTSGLVHFGRAGASVVAARRCSSRVLTKERGFAASLYPVLATPFTDADARIDAQAAAGGAAWAAAHAAGDPVRAAAHFRRAADEYAGALQLVALSSEPERAGALWRRQRDCWERVVDLVPGERVAIPYEATTLPGFFFRAAGAAAGEPRPLVLINRGCEEPTSAALALGGAAAAARGYHWLTFDGPGQQAALVEQGLTARPDWEHVLTPVVETMLAREDVDPGRLAVIGAGQAGLLVPRALAFEHRFAAAAVDPGIVDLGAPCAEQLPRGLRADLRRGDAGAFDRALHVDELLSPALTVRLDEHAAPFGLRGCSRFDLFCAVARYRLGSELDGVRTPLLVVDREGDRRWPGQSRALFDRLPGAKRLVGVGESHVFEWLDAHLA